MIEELSSLACDFQPYKRYYFFCRSTRGHISSRTDRPFRYRTNVFSDQWLLPIFPRKAGACNYVGTDVESRAAEGKIEAEIFGEVETRQRRER